MFEHILIECDALPDVNEPQVYLRMFAVVNVLNAFGKQHF